MRNKKKDKLYIIGPLNYVKQLSFAKMHVWIVIVNPETGTCIRFCDLHIYFSFCHGWSDLSIKLHLHNVNIYQYVLYLKTNIIVNYK